MVFASTRAGPAGTEDCRARRRRSSESPGRCTAPRVAGCCSVSTLEHNSLPASSGRGLGTLGAAIRQGPHRQPKNPPAQELCLSRMISSTRGVDRDGFGDRRQRRFAGAASSRIGEVARRDAIRFAAGWAVAENGHKSSEPGTGCSEQDAPVGCAWWAWDSCGGAFLLDRTSRVTG